MGSGGDVGEGHHADRVGRQDHQELEGRQGGTDIPRSDLC